MRCERPITIARISSTTQKCRTVAKVAPKFGGDEASVLKESVADHAQPRGRELFGNVAGSAIGRAVAIDIAVLGQPSGAVVEEQLATERALIGPIEDGTGIDRAAAEGAAARECVGIHL